jgi:hypothetical protein
MDSDGASAPASFDERRNQQVDNAIRAIQQKKPLPEIDFTIHTMEDGNQVSTLERVCKGEFPLARRLLDVSCLAPCPAATLPPPIAGLPRWHAAVTVALVLATLEAQGNCHTHDDDGRH